MTDFGEQVFGEGSYFILRDKGILSLDMLSNAEAVGDAGDEGGDPTAPAADAIATTKTTATSTLAR